MFNPIKYLYIMKKILFILAMMISLNFSVMAQQTANNETAATETNRILRLQFFREKLVKNPYNLPVVAGTLIVVEDICNNPTWDEVKKAQDIVAEMFAIVGEKQPSNDGEANCMEKEVSSLTKMGQALNQTALKMNSYNSEQTINIASNGSQEKLVIIDGEVSSMDKVDQSKISSMKVLEGKAAVDAYGERGKNGVIIITTQK